MKKSRSTSFSIFLERLAGILRENPIEPLTELDNLLRGYFNIGRLALGAAVRLMDHHFGIRERETLTLLARGEKNRRAGGRHADADGRDRGLYMIHGVNHRERRGDRAARGVDIERDILLLVLRFQERGAGR